MSQNLATHGKRAPPSDLGTRLHILECLSQPPCQPVATSLHWYRPPWGTRHTVVCCPFYLQDRLCIPFSSEQLHRASSSVSSLHTQSIYALYTFGFVLLKWVSPVTYLLSTFVERKSVVMTVCVLFVLSFPRTTSRST